MKEKNWNTFSKKKTGRAIVFVTLVIFYVLFFQSKFKIEWYYSFLIILVLFWISGYLNYLFTGIKIENISFFKSDDFQNVYVFDCLFPSGSHQLWFALSEDNDVIKQRYALISKGLKIDDQLHLNAVISENITRREILNIIDNQSFKIIYAKYIDKYITVIVTTNPYKINYSDEKHIVHLDDQVIFQKSFKELIDPQSNGYLVKSFSTPESALDYIKFCVSNNRKIDLIVSDLNHPGLNGFEFAKAVYEFTKNENLKIPLMIYSLMIDRQIASEDLISDGVKASDNLIHGSAILNASCEKWIKLGYFNSCVSKNTRKEVLKEELEKLI